MATRNRYAEIMSQFGQSQPFSFFGMPSGGFNPYAPDYTGGFTPYQRPIPAPSLPVEQDQYAEIIRQIGGSGGGGGYSSSPEGQAAREAPMSDSDRAFQLSVNEAIAGGIDNLSRLSPVATGLKALFSPREVSDNSTGGPSRAPSPATINVRETYRGDLADPGPGWTAENLGRGETKYTREVPVAKASFSDTEGNFDFAAFQRAGYSMPGIGGGQGRSGGGYTVGGYTPGSQAAAAAASGTVGGYGPGTPGFNRGMTGLAKGGEVSMQHLQGPDPEGPDDGYAALKMGEFVINDKAVKKYGIELMHAINSGKISKGKLRGLLEM
jgi:hypothetical protein